MDTVIEVKDPVQLINELVESKRIDLAGKQVELRICKTRHIPVVVGFISSLATELDLRISEGADVSQRLLLHFDNIGFILKLISNHSDAFFNIITLLTNLSKEQVEELDLDELLIVVKGVVEVNKHFFLRRVAPALATVLPERMRKATQVSNS